MKRTQTVNLQRMRKHFVPRLKPLTVAVSSVILVACGEAEFEANIYENVRQCIADYPLQANRCEAAYQHALTESFRTGPKYRSEGLCEYDFGEDECIPYNVLNDQVVYMPEMDGFFYYGGDEDWDDEDISNPLYSSKRKRSPAYKKWTTADGILYGQKRVGKIKVAKSSFTMKSASTRTLSRGGFGSSVVSRSSSSRGS